jgi:hypothetical protein
MTFWDLFSALGWLILLYFIFQDDPEVCEDCGCEYEECPECPDCSDAYGEYPICEECWSESVTITRTHSSKTVSTHVECRDCGEHTHCVEDKES